MTTDRTADNSSQAMGSVRVYAFYRATFSLLFLAILLGGTSRGLLAATQPLIQSGTIYAFIATSAVFLAHALWRRFALRPSVLFIHLVVDVGCMAALTFASGGVASGFGVPLLITIACGAAAFGVRLALLLAAIASLAVLGQEIAVALTRNGEPGPVAAGLLGMLLFASAISVQRANSRLRSAQRREAVHADTAAQLQHLNELIIQRMLTGILVVNPSGRIELINAAAVGLLGGHQPQRPLAPRQFLGVCPELMRLHQRWKAYPWLQLPTFASGGTEVQASFASLDRRDGQRTLIFLEDNRASAQRAQQLKLASLGGLTAGIAHEIRNPLGAISHAAQLLGERGASDASVRQLAEIIVRHSERLNQIVENVLQLSRQKPAELVRFDLKRWLQKFLAEFTQRPGPSAAIEADTRGPALLVEFDPSQLNQVLINLLDNAVRHSAEHSGEHWAALELGTDAASGRPWLDVHDRGTGIGAIEQQRLFEPFFTTSRTGTGLGLYISRELCTMNRATLEYRPPPQIGLATGACFRIGFGHPDRVLDQRPRTIET
ncbi:MAG: PAS domain-containing sensor histidine kinase [Porticoccaceae bacterium]